MFLTKNDNLNKLSYGFATLFIAVGGIQQYLTPYFNSLGQSNVGFNVLLIIYISIFISNFSASFFINKFGTKTLLIVTALFYLLALILILFTNEYIAYLGAMVLGFGGAVLWNSQNGYLLKISSKENRGKNSGFFIAVFQAGSLLSLVVLGLILEIYSFEKAFIFVLAIGFLSLLFFMKLDAIDEVVQPKKSFAFSLRTTTLFKVSFMNAFSYHLIYGLSFSLVPLHIYLVTKSTFIVGVVSLFFYLFPMLFSKKVGVYSDLKGRSRVAFVGGILSILGLLIFHFSDGLLMLILGSMLLASAMTLLSPIFIALQGDISSVNTQVYVTNIFMFFKYLGLIVGIAIGMFFGIELAYIAIMVLVLISLLLGYKLMLDIPLLATKIEKEIDLISA